MVFVGIETPDRETLASVGKRQNLRSDMLASVRTIQRKGMEVSAGFILGFDSDPGDILDRLMLVVPATTAVASVVCVAALPTAVTVATS